MQRIKIFEEQLSKPVYRSSLFDITMRDCFFLFEGRARVNQMFSICPTTELFWSFETLDWNRYVGASLNSTIRRLLWQSVGMRLSC